YLMRAFRRGFRGGSGPSLPSRFLQDIPEKLIKRVDKNEPKSQKTERRSSNGPIGTRKASEGTGRRQGFEFSSAKRVDSPSRSETPNSKPKLKLKPSKRPAPPRPRPMRRTAARSAATVFKAGDKVTHATFGEGMVVSSEPSGDDFEVTVAFKEGHGVKRLLMSFAKLTKVE
ncbi:MAG: hypothetical protein IIC24_07680, partial [Chloroflexi bacterium]|nr:hypothetical protein [Chloroflexota bacterium]